MSWQDAYLQPLPQPPRAHKPRSTSHICPPLSGTSSAPDILPAAVQTDSAGALVALLAQYSSHPSPGWEPSAGPSPGGLGTGLWFAVFMNSLQPWPLLQQFSVPLPRGSIFLAPVSLARLPEQEQSVVSLWKGGFLSRSSRCGRGLSGGR